ncbi:diaminopimelate decarboxylase [Ktedonobacteria bacterium brp13]|nr:diaminopimelate decarboxylase [Ktedonobacteria bacterium brp13]
MYRLTPSLAPAVEHFLQTYADLVTLPVSFGSPLNLLFPACMTEATRAFIQTLEDHSLQGKVYFAHKPNKSKALVKQAYADHIAIDVASKAELLDALEAGFTGEMIEATGPKNKEFLLLALQQHCTITIDSVDELELLLQYMSVLHLTPPAAILVRWNGLHSQKQHVLTKESRFGIHVNRFNEVMALCHDSRLDLRGFAFHIDTTSESEKVAAIEHTLLLMLQAQEEGFTLTVMNIGGGFKVNYLAYQEEWDAYTTAIKQSIAGEIAPLTWNSTGYGFKLIDGQVRGAPTYYQYYNASAGPAFLQRLLAAPLERFEQRTVAQVLNDLMLELWIEPGRALLDQCGLTLALVTFVKRSLKGEWLVGLDMNKSNLSSIEDEMLCDPLVFSHHEQAMKDDISEQGVYFVGNLCQEHDVIYRHKTFLPRLPCRDDLVVFVNTAAYHMDFNESASIQHPTAKKLVVVETGATTFRLHEDYLYQPLLMHLDKEEK